jgi:hypothetical protein
MFICKFCNKEFKPNYRVGKKIINFCSKSCKSKLQKSTYLDKKDLEENIKKLIIIKNTYVLKEEILKELKISSKTLVKFNISIVNLNYECGMKKCSSIFEKRCVDIISKLYDDEIILQKSFDDLRSPKNYKLRFDLYIPNQNLIIEFDGAQHYDKTSKYYSEYGILCDNIKNEYCESNNIHLIRIPYKRYVTENYIKQFIKI